MGTCLALITIMSLFNSWLIDLFKVSCLSWAQHQLARISDDRCLNSKTGHQIVWICFFVPRCIYTVYRRWSRLSHRCWWMLRSATAASAQCRPLHFHHRPSHAGHCDGDDGDETDFGDEMSPNCARRQSCWSLLPGIQQRRRSQWCHKCYGVGLPPHRLFTQHNRQFLPATMLEGKVMQNSHVCLLVSTLISWANWSLSLIFCTCTGHDHSSQVTKWAQVEHMLYLQ